MTDSLIEIYDRGFERDSIVWIAICRKHWLKISDRVTQLRQELSLAEEGLANYQQENERLNAHCVQISKEHHDALDEAERLRAALERITECIEYRDGGEGVQVISGSGHHFWEAVREAKKITHPHGRA